MKKLFLQTSVTLCILSSLLSCTNDKDNYEFNPTIKALSPSDQNDIIYYRGPSHATLPFGKGDYDSKYCNTCLFMDIRYGKIDLEKTAAGIYFPIHFNNEGRSITVNVLLSGVRYPDSTYSLGSESTYLRPYYNAGNSLAPAGSYFDTPPLGTRSLKDQGVAIDQNTGIIDLRQTINNGALQGADNKEFRMYYKLNDASNFALNFTDFIIIHSPSLYTTSGKTGHLKNARIQRTQVLDERCRTKAVVVK